MPLTLKRALRVLLLGAALPLVSTVHAADWRPTPFA